MSKVVLRCRDVLSNDVLSKYMLGRKDLSRHVSSWGGLSRDVMSRVMLRKDVLSRYMVSWKMLSRGELNGDLLSWGWVEQ